MMRTPILKHLPKLRLLPLTIFAAVLMLGVRVGDVWRLATTGAPVPEVAPTLAQDAVETPAAPVEPAPAPAAEDVGGGAAPTDDGLSALFERLRGQNFSELQQQIQARLQERREALERRARELEQREALLTAAETRVDQKIAELQELRRQIETLLAEADAKQQEKLDSLVKIYENMKPKDAARIFEELDMPVLLDVVARMREQKIAPIMAAMDPAKAREVTASLVAEGRLPSLPQ